MAFGKLSGRTALSKILGELPPQNPLRWHSEMGKTVTLSVSPGTGSTNKDLGKNQLPLNTSSGRGTRLVLAQRTTPTSGAAAVKQLSLSEISSAAASVQQAARTTTCVHTRLSAGGEGCTAALGAASWHGSPARSSAESH